MSTAAKSATIVGIAVAAAELSFRRRMKRKRESYGILACLQTWSD